MAKKKDKSEETQKEENKSTESDIEKRFDRFLEEVKITNDFLKHIATLDTGSILIMATFLQKSTKPLAGIFVGLAVFAFVISLVGVVVSQRTLVNHISLSTGDISQIPLKTNKFPYQLPIFIALGFFLIALGILLGFIVYIMA